jgi:subtilisin family serine protease
VQVVVLHNLLKRGLFFLVAVLLLAGMSCQAPDEQEERATLRLVVQTGEETDPSDVARRVGRVLDRPAQVEPLFENVDPMNDPDLLAQMFLVIVPEGKAVTEKSWDLAYAVKESTGFDTVEPDGEKTLELATAAMTSTCFLGGSVSAPANKTWSLDNMRIREAWALNPKPDGRRRGEGIRICHPDTGWSEHRDLDTDHLDLANAKNLLPDGASDGRDPLDYSGPLLNPGHGTATGSVIISEEMQGSITGVAPDARLVPIRTAKSVVQVFDSDLARAVNHAVNVDCDVISMSLGGRAFFGLSAAIRNAKRSNLIVLAAAGNCVRFVVAPAAYDNCIAVAATNVEDRPWRGSSRGRKVAISAPGEHVWTARRSSTSETDTLTSAGEGTSFAVASTAGTAALWLAYHNLDRHTTRYGDRLYLQDLFIRALAETARTPTDWNSLEGKYGAGIVDAVELLEWELPVFDDPSLTSETVLREMAELQLLANITDRNVDTLASQLLRRLDSTTDNLASTLDMYGSELIQLALEDPGAFEQYLDGDPSTTSARTIRTAISSRASQRLGALMGE